MYAPYIGKHLPLISPRISFPLHSDRALPYITPRIEVDDLQVIVRRRQEHQERLPLSQPVPHRDLSQPGNRTSADNRDFPELVDPLRCDPSSASVLRDSEERVERASSSSVASASSISPRLRLQTPSFASLAHSSPEFRDASETPNQADKYKTPLGQPGRPNCGGYNLEHKLLQDCAWTREMYDAVQVHVHLLAKRDLDLTKSYQQQNTDKLRKLCQEIVENYKLHQYQDSWPIRAMLKLYLKASSESHRRSQRSTPGKARSHLRRKAASSASVGEALG
ncbi:hypothetical protein B0H16DRAFT_1733736 [Mycena metata]|uniref:Uncharacterized protein n=1 Tax=Mycena metata TaxID=1033252 RepID=A0AAD7HXN9_9AGAR|nr:hypothetical protein B0H16DRAFT_1733736 [Mycena metata]